MIPRQPGWWGAPLAPVYGAVVRARGWAFDRGLLPRERFGAFTVCVGGLEAGGTGKTPVVLWVLRALLEAGRRPGLATRGYGRRSRGLVLRTEGALALPDVLGDEASEVAFVHPGVPIAACSSRRRAAKGLVGLGCDTVVMDDGFSHRFLMRDLDIVVLRGEAPLGSASLLPLGSLREPPAALRRAHVLWFHFREGGRESLPAWAQERQLAGAHVVVSEVSTAACADRDGRVRDAVGAKVLVAAGVARPHSFARAAARAGLEVREVVAFADHHQFSRRDVDTVQQRAADCSADAVLVTRKDLVKLQQVWPAEGVPLWFFTSELRVVEGEAGLRAALGLPPSRCSP